MASKLKKFDRNPGNYAFAYYRYSSDAQRDVSIDQQRDAAHEYAKSHGMVIPEGYEFEDRSITGTTIERPGLEHMLFEAKHKRPAYLILWKLDRLSRQVHDSFAIDAQLRDLGVQIVTIAEPLPEDEAMRYTMQALYAAMAQNFIITHRSNVLRGLNYNAQNGLYNGRKILGYIGETNKPYIIDNSQAPVVKKIFSDYANGTPLQKIADELNEAGFRSVKGNKFVVSSLSNIIKNRAYIGEYKWGDHLIPGGMPRIIDDNLFEEANNMLLKNKRGGKHATRKLKPEKVDFWLTGHVYCGKCGGSMYGISGTSKSGEKYYYYTCLNHKKHKCDQKNKKKEDIELIVKNTLNDMIFEPATRLLIAEMCYNYYQETQGEDRTAYINSLHNELKDVEKKLHNFVKAIEKGIFNDTTQMAMSELEKRQKLLREQISAEEQREKYEISYRQIVHYLECFVGDLDEPEVLERLLDIMVDKVYLYDEEMIMTFNYTEDRQEINYKEKIAGIKATQVLIDMMGVFPEDRKPEKENTEYFFH